MIWLALAAAAAAVPTPVAIPDQPALTEQLVRVESEFFQLFFEGSCDLPRFRGYLTEDVEFYHDKGGFNVHNADEFTAIFAKNCKDREDPTTWRSRRELVRTSVHVDPVPGWGAIETGDHLFFETISRLGTLVDSGEFARRELNDATSTR